MSSMRSSALITESPWEPPSVSVPSAPQPPAPAAAPRPPPAPGRARAPPCASWRARPAARAPPPRAAHSKKLSRGIRKI